MKRGWFGPRRIGFGIGPRRWQGWLATGLFAVALVGGNMLLRRFAPVPIDRLAYDGAVLLAFLLVVALTYRGDRS